MLVRTGLNAEKVLTFRHTQQKVVQTSGNKACMLAQQPRLFCVDRTPWICDDPAVCVEAK